MSGFHPLSTPAGSRRDALLSLGAGIGALALPELLDADTTSLAPRSSHHQPRAKHIIHIYLNGGPSQVDTWDPKPVLDRHDGRPIPVGNLTTERETGVALASPFRFQQYGDSGLWASTVFEKTASRHADRLCVIRSMHCDQIEHSGAIRQLTTGDGVLPRPSVGSWTLYGLGSETDNLPGFVSIGAQGNLPGKPTYGSSFLPTAFEGTSITDVNHPIDNLAMPVPQAIQSARLAAIRRLSEQHRQRRADDRRLDARIAAYELAFRMQTEAPAAFDLSRESQAMHRLYGLGDKNTAEYGRQCLLARRLVERGVRYVVANVNNKWDDHGDVHAHKKPAALSDQPVAALLTDLKARGMLDETLVVWGGEFGRTPTAQGGGRDHHPYGFSMWLAGGGVRSGMTYGATDEFGFFAVDNQVHIHDLHATILHLLGLDHEQLTYRYAGRDFRLTDVYGDVVQDVIA